MKKIWLLVLSVAFVATAYYFVTNYLFYDISLRGVVPAIRLPGNDIKQYLPLSSQFTYPLRMPSGYTLDIFAELDGSLPRVLVFDPSGTLIVSSPRKGRVMALPDKNRDGKADEVVTVLSGLNQPHGIAFDGDYIYVAETDKVVRYTYNTSNNSVGLSEELFELPGGGRHFTRTIRIHDNRLYTSVGSSCDTCIETDWRRASILVSNLDGTDLKVFAKGLRNTVFFTFDNSGNMWGTDMGRDFLGDDLPPDELNIIEEGKDYGWPWCYGNRVRDSKFKPGEKPSYCTDTEPPVYSFQAHVAPLGLVFIDSNQFSASEQGNLIVAFHGSWNRSEPVGYEIRKLSIFAQNVTSEDVFVTGWLKDGDTLGRPVDLAFDEDGNLYISDDNAGLVYILSRLR
jgi:glucose/arabinose dehydrogenase